MNYFKLTALSLSLSVLAISCNGPAEKEETANENSEFAKVEGGKFRGGELKLNSIEDYTTLFPASTNDVFSEHIARQGYEGLLMLNQKTLEVEPGIAENFEIDNSKKVYTFHLRDNVKFFDDECFEGGIGRSVNAADFKYCFEFLCSNHKMNKWSSLLRDKVKGAKDYGMGRADQVMGIKVIDDLTLQIELINPYAGFPFCMAAFASSVYPKEAINKYGYEGMKDRIVGTGPFIPESIENGNKVTFKKNPNYWRKDEFGNQLPLLDEVIYAFIKDKEEELAAFKRDELDMIWELPVDEIQNIMGTLEDAKDGKNKAFEVQSINSLQVQYFGFLNSGEVFNDVRVRKAFSYAVNKDSIIDFVLQGEGTAANSGFIPAMKGYPIENVNGYTFDPVQAKRLIAEAGYPEGKGFPNVTLNLNVSGGTNQKIADAVREMWKNNLGVDVEINIIPMAELHPQVERAQVDFWKFGWIADYPDPANFLHLFYGQNIVEGQETSINYFRYSSQEFDALYEAAILEIDDEKRMDIFAQADQLLMDDAVVLPLYYNTSIRLINPQVKDFDINEMEYRDLSMVYYKEVNKDNVRVYDNLVEEE